MATKERQVNININYKVNTVDIDKSNALLTRASQSTDNLRRQTQTFGQQSAQAYRFTSKAIEGMEIEVARLRQQVKLASTENTADVKRLSDQYKSAKAQLDAYNRSLLEQTKATKQTAASTQDLAGNFGQVIAAAKGLIAVGLAKEAVNISLSLAKLSGNVQGVERAFNRAFPNSVQLLNDLKEATHGTVTEFELMQRTLQATNLGVSVGKLPILFEFAAARAQQTGESVDYLVDSIVRGIGRKSPLILDNLGLSAVRLKEEFNGASLAAQSVADVTEAVGRIAQVELGKMGGYAETAATKVDQLTASVDELKVAFAKKQEDNGNVISGFLADIVKGWTEVIKGEKTLASEEAKNRAARQVDNIIQSKAFKDLKDNQVGQIDLLFQEIIQRRNLLKLRTEEIKLGEERRKELANDITIFNKRAVIDPLDEQLKSQRQSKAVLEESIAILLKYLADIRSISAEEKEQLGIIEAKRKEIEAISEALEKATSKDQIIKLRWDLDFAQGELADLLELAPKGKEMKAPKKMKFSFFSEEAAEELQKSIDEILLHKPLQANVQVTPYTPMDDWDKVAQQWEQEWRGILGTGLNDTVDYIMATENAEIESLRRRMDATRSYYDEQINLAGDNERRKAEIRIREDRAIKKIQQDIALREWKAKRNSILLSTAAGIARAFVDYPWPYSLIPAAVVAAQGGAQLAIADKEKPRFAKGVIDLKGPGTGTSDSIQARLSRGESVMTAEETRTSKGIFKAVRAKKLNDKVIQEIVSGRSGGSVFNDSNIVSELSSLRKEVRENRPPSLVKEGGLLMEAREKGKNLREKRRAKIGLR